MLIQNQLKQPGQIKQKYIQYVTYNLILDKYKTETDDCYTNMGRIQRK